MAHGSVTALDAGVERVRGLVEDIVANPAATLLELKKRLASTLGIEARPEVLQALAALPELQAASARAVAIRAATLNLFMEASSAPVWAGRRLDTAELTTTLETLPALLRLAQAERAGIDDDLRGVERMQRDAAAKLVQMLAVSDDAVNAALAVGPEMVHLAHHTTELVDVEAQAVASAAAGETDRAVVAAIALRSRIERILREQGGAPISEATRVILSDLRRSHAYVSHRLDAIRTRRFEQTKGGDRQLDGIRKRLFTTYLALTKALAGELTEAETVVRERIAAAEAAAAAIDAEKASTEGLMKDATTRTAEAPREAAVSMDARDVAGERRRKKILTWVFASLLPVAIGVNVWLLPRRGSQKVVLEMLNGAMPVSDVTPIGGVLYSQVATFLWDGMSEEQRREKVEILGRVAGRQGYRSLVIVDENRRERAYWTATGGVTFREPSQTEATPPAATAAPPRVR